MMWLLPLPHTTGFCLPYRGSAFLKGLVTVPYKKVLTEDPPQAGLAGWGRVVSAKKVKSHSKKQGGKAGSQPQVAAYLKADVSGLAYFWKR